MPALCDAIGGACESEPDDEPPLRLHLDIEHDAGDWGAVAPIEAALQRAGALGVVNLDSGGLAGRVLAAGSAEKVRATEDAVLRLVGAG